MSSTNRGGIREVSDYYITPKNEIKNFLSVFMYDIEKLDDFVGNRPDRAL